jgi:hypothetical protein
MLCGVLCSGTGSKRCISCLNVSPPPAILSRRMPQDQSVASDLVINAPPPW